MLASVMMIREGGVEKALEAVPMLHDETHAYIKTVSLMAKDPALFNISNWKGMSDASAAKIAFNYTAKFDNKTDPLKDALAAKFNTAGPIDPKWNKTTDAMNALGDKIANDDSAFISALNDKLAQYNIVVTGKSVGQPTKFNAAASLISRAMTGVALSATGVNFAPCLISYAATGVAAGAIGVNVAPVGFGLTPNGVTTNVQGVNLQPVLILVQPIGANGKMDAWIEREREREREARGARVCVRV